MKGYRHLVLVAAAAIGLAACEDMDYLHHHGSPGTYVDGYYDDFYGPFYDGYWGDGGVFYYRTTRDGEFRRDDAHHFSHGRGNGFNSFHMRVGQAPHH